jgi:death-on-curing protein
VGGGVRGGREAFAFRTRRERCRAPLKPSRVLEAVVLAVHEEQLAEHGGAPGIRDQGLLESALAPPRNLAGDGKPDIFALAASYGYGLALNHPFVDRNKRVSLAVTELFLELNGFALTAGDDEMLAVWMRLSAGKTTEAELAAWLREWGRAA